MASQINTSGTKSFPAGEDLAIFRRVRIVAGSAFYADADDLEDGITDRSASSGDPVPVRLRTSQGTRKVEIAGAVVQDALLKGAASGKVDDASSGGATRFRALEAGSAAGSIIEVLCQDSPAGDLVYSAIANSAVLGAPSLAAEVDFSLTKSIDGDELQVGDVFEIFAQGIATHTHSTDTLNVKAYAGGQLLAATGALDVADGNVFTVHLFMTVGAIGAGGKVRAGGTTCIGTVNSATAKPTRLAEAAVDLSGAVIFKLSATWSVADAGNDCTLEIFNVIKHRQ